LSPVHKTIPEEELAARQKGSMPYENNFKISRFPYINLENSA